ncbi:hypothetical protein KGM_212506 [Danaus plexippus plexippus]|uniref:Uncharacterized protein n=1 Tax=Danaus plexippus plexippus TaxID=278856 RepID=A0A212FL67_DANPL|nr:hypothetical protein KGM_212506 [Danaus plexippus plexippus]
MVQSQAKRLWSDDITSHCSSTNTMYYNLLLIIGCLFIQIIDETGADYHDCSHENCDNTVRVYMDGEAHDIKIPPNVVQNGIPVEVARRRNRKIRKVSRDEEVSYIPVFLFSNHVIDHMTGGNINFQGTTDIKIDQKDQSSKKLRYEKSKNSSLGRLLKWLILI